MNKLDELFKEKLSEYTVAPSAGAWDKVETGLSKKNSTIAWLRWAAVFLLGGLLLGSLWLQRQDSSLPLSKVEESIPQKQETEIQKSTTPAVTENKSATIKKIAGRRKAVNLNPANAFQASDEKAVAQKEEEQSSIPPQVLETPSIEVAKVSTKASQGIVLTYTLGPVEPRLEEVADAATAEKKDKSLKRMVDFAWNVKNSESPLSGIRVMKEDLFALDLKKKTTSKNH